MATSTRACLPKSNATPPWTLRCSPCRRATRWSTRRRPRRAGLELPRDHSLREPDRLDLGLLFAHRPRERAEEEFLKSRVAPDLFAVAERRVKDAALAVVAPPRQREVFILA